MTTEELDIMIGELDKELDRARGALNYLVGKRDACREIRAKLATPVPDDTAKEAA